MFLHDHTVMVALNVSAEATLLLVSPPGRDSRDSRSSRLAETTEKALGTIAPSNWFRCLYLVPSSHLSNIYSSGFVSGSFLTFIQHLQNRF